MPSYKQNQAADLLPDGIYPFYVKNAKLTTAATGSEMINLTLQVNGTFTVYDNLVFVENAGWKIDQFRIATGEVLGAAGSDANLEDTDCIQRRGEVEIGTDEFPKNSGRMRNVVVGYIDPKRNSPKAAVAAAVPVKRADPDDIPF
jgi:hypothetical protein